MSAHNIIELASEASVDRAWNDYASMARRILDDHTLLWDREFNQQLTRLHEKWKRLFLIQEHR